MSWGDVKGTAMTGTAFAERHGTASPTMPKICGKNNLYAQMAQQPHVLIAGMTGAGKSVALRGFMAQLLLSDPKVRLVLIDPKRVELAPYRRIAQCYRFAVSPDGTEQCLREVTTVLEARLDECVDNGTRTSDRPHIWCVIDEYADLMMDAKAKKQLKPLICHIAQLGRAANIHLVLATQRPTADVVDGQIKCNIAARLALRVPTAQDSRNLISVNGAETLPKYGEAIYTDADYYQPRRVRIPNYTDTAERYVLDALTIQSPFASPEERKGAADRVAIGIGADDFVLFADSCCGSLAPTVAVS